LKHGMCLMKQNTFSNQVGGMWEWIKSFQNQSKDLQVAIQLWELKLPRCLEIINWGLEGQRTSKLTNHGLNGKVLMIITNEWDCIAKQKVFSW
jgi:hypothetical protein